MAYMIGLLGITCLIILGNFLYYRHQIKDMGRQLEKISKQSTNQLLTQELFWPEITYLIQAFNQALIKERNLSKEIQQKDWAKQNLMTNLSHDVRTPLTSLMGYIQLLETAEKPEDRQRYFQVIYQRLDKLKDLLDRLFLLERLEDQAFKLRMQDLDFNEFMRQQLISYYDQLMAQDFAVDLCLPEAQYMVQADPDLMAHVIDNLIKNTMDHGQDYLGIESQLLSIGKPLEHFGRKDFIEAEEISIDTAKCDYLRVRFVNCLSHPVEEDPNLWLDRFYQASHDRSRTKQNTGLGLSIVRSALEKMGARIFLQVKEDKLLLDLWFSLQRPSHID